MTIALWIVYLTGAVTVCVATARYSYRRDTEYHRTQPSAWDSPPSMFTSFLAGWLAGMFWPLLLVTGGACLAIKHTVFKGLA